MNDLLPFAEYGVAVLVIAAFFYFGHKIAVFGVKAFADLGTEFSTKIEAIVNDHRKYVDDLQVGHRKDIEDMRLDHRNERTEWHQRQEVREDKMDTTITKLTNAIEAGNQRHRRTDDL